MTPEEALDYLLLFAWPSDREGVASASAVLRRALTDPLTLLEQLARVTASEYGGFASFDLPPTQVDADYFAVAWTHERGYDYQTGIGGYSEEDKKHYTREEAEQFLAAIIERPA